MSPESNINTQKKGETPERIANAEIVVGWAVFGSLVGGGVGVCKAMAMHSAVDVLLCLLGAVACFGMVFYLYLRKS